MDDKVEFQGKIADLKIPVHCFRCLKWLYEIDRDSGHEIGLCNECRNEFEFIKDGEMILTKETLEKVDLSKALANLPKINIEELNQQLQKYLHKHKEQCKHKNISCYADNLNEFYCRDCGADVNN